MAESSDQRSDLSIPIGLATILEECESLPRPPGIAFRVLQRTQDQEASASEIAQVLAVDPVLAGIIVRTANSPIYAQRGEIKSLERAVTVLGFTATGTVAVSFSLLKSLKASREQGAIDFQLFWRRSLLAAIAGRVLGMSLRNRNEDEVFLASLLQDIGILALSRAMPSLYDGLEADQLHQETLIAREQERFGADHSAVGAWLAYRWQFPDDIARGILGSHRPERVSSEKTIGGLAGCVAVSSAIAEVFLDRSGTRRFENMAQMAERYLGLQKASIVDLVGRVGDVIPDSEPIYEMKILEETDPDSVVEEASESLGLASEPTVTAPGAAR